MKSLDTAGRIRVSDELFGGSAGERFVQLIDQGEDGLRKTIERGRELGAVLDQDVILKAQELDRRWTQLQTRMGSFWDDPAKENLVNPATSLAPTTSIRPRSAPALLGEPELPDKPDAPASGGRTESEYEAALTGIAAETAALEAESVAVINVAGSGKEYGDAIEFARAKSELLIAAQRSGITVTPELDAKLDELAVGYACVLS